MSLPMLPSKAFTKSIDSPFNLLVLSCALTPGFTPASISTILPSIEELFRQFIQAYIEKIRDQILPPAFIEGREKTLNRLLKVRNPKLYFGNFYIKYYYFCQQYKDYFKTAGAKGYKRVFFIASFLHNKINFY